MKLFFKVILAVLVIGALLPFTILKDSNGYPLMKFSDIGLPDLPFELPGFQLPDVTTLSPSDKTNLQTADEIKAADDDLAGKDIFYQWFDAEGNIQFTSEPPPKGVNYTVKGYDPDANVIPSVSLPAEKSDSEDESSSEESLKDDKLTNPYAQDSIKKLFEDAKNIEKMLDQRFKDQGEVLNQ